MESCKKWKEKTSIGDLKDFGYGKTQLHCILRRVNFLQAFHLNLKKQHQMQSIRLTVSAEILQKVIAAGVLKNI